MIWLRRMRRADRTGRRGRGSRALVRANRARQRLPPPPAPRRRFADGARSWHAAASPRPPRAALSPFARSSAPLTRPPRFQPRAPDRYWDDTDLMSKISSKLRALQLSKQQREGEQQQGGAPSKHAAPAPARKVETLHDAARWGDAEAAAKLIADGADVNAKVGLGRSRARRLQREGACRHCRPSQQQQLCCWRPLLGYGLRPCTDRRPRPAPRAPGARLHATLAPALPRAAPAAPHVPAAGPPAAMLSHAYCMLYLIHACIYRSIPCNRMTAASLFWAWRWASTRRRWCSCCWTAAPTSTPQTPRARPRCTTPRVSAPRVCAE